MRHFTGMTACLFLCQLLFSQVAAFALDKGYIVDQIRRNGALEFIRHVIKNSTAMQYGMSPKEQEELFNGVQKYSQRTLKDVNATTACSLPGYEANIIEIVHEDTTNLVFILSSSDRYDSVYNIKFINLADGNFLDDLRLFYGMLDDARIDTSVVDATRKAIQDMFHNRDPQIFYDYEKNLAGKATPLPTYVAKKLSSKTDDFLKRHKSVLDLLKVDGDVKYLGTKSLIGQHLISLYGVATDWGPLVVSVHLVALETGPVVGGSWLGTGSKATPYINEYINFFLDERAATSRDVGK